MVKELSSEDITLFNILPRLPAKSVLRFKTVSKQWYSFVTNSKFTKMHLQHQDSYKLLTISTTRPCKYRAIDCEAPDDRLTISRSLPFVVPSRGNISILTTFNGLVCVGIKNDWYYNCCKYSDLVLWNPLTGEYKTLSKTNSHDECYHINSERPCLLYYNSIEDDYKLLRVTKSRYVYVYSLKLDSWRKVELTEELHRVSAADVMPLASALDENLYFLKRDNTMYQEIYSFLRFDLNTEMFTEIPAPFLKEYKCHGLMVIRNRVHVWRVSYLWHRNIELWKMDRNWTKVASYTEPTRSVQPLHLMKNGNWLMNNEGNLCVVNPKKKGILSAYTYHHMNIFFEGKYIETFVSPNQYIK